MYYSAIGILAIIILFIVNWDILRDSRTFEKPAWNVYRRFLFAVLVYYIVDVLWGVMESQKLSAALFADTTIYFIAMAVGISFWAEFTVAYLEEKHTFGNILILTGRVLAGGIFCLAIINIFIPVLFAIDKKCVYTALPLRYILLVCQIFFLLIISIRALLSMHRMKEKKGSKTRFRILASFGITMGVGLFVQLWFPYLPLYSIAYMLGTCMLHSFLVNDEKEDYKREIAEAEKVAILKDRFFAVLENMPGMTFTKDAETGKYLTCNQAFAKYANKENPDGVIGLTDAEIFDAETAAHFVEDDKIALSLSKPYIFYEDVPDAAGNPKTLQTTKLKYIDTAGRKCVLGMCQDITEQVRIEHEQAMTKEAYEKAIASSLLYTHISQTLARDYTELFYVNADTEEFREYCRGEDGNGITEVKRGWHFFSDGKMELCESVYEDDKESFLLAMNRKNLMKVLSRKDTFVMTYRRIIGGRPVYVNMKISRMENDEKSIIIGFTNVDAEMREAMAKSEALSEALLSAEAAQSARSTFLAGMSHEIRTPINAIIGLDTLALKKNNLDDETRGYFEKIQDSAQQLLVIINDVLNISRLESGMVVLNNNPFLLSDMMEQVNLQVERQCEYKGLDFECHILNEMSDSYIGDEMKLKDVLLNILSNAVKFTDESGKITLTVEKTAEVDNQSTLRFCVKDTGIGMDEETVSNLFDIFDKEGNVIKKGTSGLGMAITNKIVQMMDGTITVESEPDVGTEFIVMVTLLQGDSNDSVYSTEIDTEAINILVVDDSPIEAEHARLVLEEAGIKAASCTSGPEALQRLEIQKSKGQMYNIVLMDWNMPGMSGQETAAEVLRLYENECIVVAMTSYSWEDIYEEAAKAGVDNFIGKPLFTSNILENISRIARRSHLAVFKEKEKARLEGRRILLAEDVDINAEILVDILEMENIKVDHAGNGKEAVELFENSTSGIYSAILMDVRMPEMDGLSATKVIRAMEREDAKRIPIIALTANAFDEDVQSSIQAGMNAHLTKPIEADRLVRILGELIYESEQAITGV